jgi:hypothetical protein
MADDFDPYYQWLGISPKHQPANHYRLLGLELFEANADVISTAADQRMAHIRSFQTGKNSAVSQKILNELSTARRCLLNAAAKGEYDTQLRARRAAEAPPAAAPEQPADERWARDFAADVKAASRFATGQAERLKITSLKLPAAYAALGSDIRREKVFMDVLAELHAGAAMADSQLQQIKDNSRSQEGITSKVVSRVQLESAQRKYDAALTELGKAAYQLHRGDSSTSELVATIDALEKRLGALDAELATLEQSRSGRLIGPKWLAIGALGVVLLILLVITSGALRNLLLLLVLAGAGYLGYRNFTKK